MSSCFPSSSSLEGLRRVMSAPEMLAFLRGHWDYPERIGYKLEDCRIIRVQNLKGVFILDYEMIFSGNGRQPAHPLLFIGQYFGARVEDEYRDVTESLRKEKRKQLSRRSPPSLITCFPDLGLVLRAAGIDERINGLKHIFRQRFLARALSKALRAHYKEITKCRAEILGHRLGKRCVVRYHYKKRDGKTRSVIGKIYRSPELGRHVYLTMKELWKNGFAKDAADQISIPKPLDYVHASQLIVMEDVSGASLRRPDNVPIELIVHTAGKTLAKLHRTPLTLSKEHSIEDEVEILTNNVQVSSFIYPELKPTLTKYLHKTLEAFAHCRRFKPALVHRDFHERQTLVHNNRSVLLDFDTLCMSDPALDVGNYLAHLDLLELQGLLDSKPLRRIFLSVYDFPAQENFQNRVEAYKMASFLRLACQYPLQSPWRHLKSLFIRALE